MEIPASLFPAMTAWTGSSGGFRGVNIRVGDVKTNEQNVSLGVVGSVHRVCGKTADCSAVGGTLGARICPGSQREQPSADGKVRAVFPESQLPVEEEEGRLRLGRGALASVLLRIRIEGLAAAASLRHMSLSAAYWCLYR